MVKGKQIGGWAFLAGVILALVIGVFDITQVWAMYALLVIGLAIGLLNINDKETMPFLMSGIVLIIATSLGGGTLYEITYVGGILKALLAIFTPAVIVVAIRNAFSMAKN
jgi:hypothetical protein